MISSSMRLASTGFCFETMKNGVSWMRNLLKMKILISKGIEHKPKAHLQAWLVG